MKNKIISILIVNLVFCGTLQVAAQFQHTKQTTKTFKLSKEPTLGMRLPFKRRSNALLMTASGSLDPSYEVEFRGIEFTVCARKDRLITHVSTNDRRFRTPEGIAVGDSLQKVLKVSNSELAREPGWAFYMQLESGWIAGFTQGESMTDGELPSEAKVKFLFKR